MRKQFRDIINQQNALHSTTDQKRSARPYPRNAESERSISGQGPETPEGRKRSSLNAFKHGLSGNHLVMQQHEFAAYETMSRRMTRDLSPETEPEKQIAQKIIDLNFRINRLTAIENNMLNIDMKYHEPELEEDDGIAAMMGQARAWKQDAQSFEILGRYEARLSRQLIQYQNELTRMQTARRAIQSRDREEVAVTQTKQTASLNPESASFGRTPAYIMSAQPAPTPVASPVLPDASHPHLRA